MPRLAPHDLRRSCARFCHAAGGELEQIQFLLGHVSVQTTERYLGCKQSFAKLLTTESASNQARESERVGRRSDPFSYRDTDNASTDTRR